MCLDYSRLWKLLIDKNLNKMDLIELTGISSRVVAKLTRNETVTTDTLARICHALECNLEDIAELGSKKNSTLYNHLKKYGKLIEDVDNYRLTEVTIGQDNYLVYLCKAPLSKSAHVICSQDETVYVEHFYPFGGMSSPIKDKSVLVKPTVRKRTATLVVLRGRPGMLAGLDEGVFVSHAPHSEPQKNKVTILSEAELKLIQVNLAD